MFASRDADDCKPLRIHQSCLNTVNYRRNKSVGQKGDRIKADTVRSIPGSGVSNILLKDQSMALTRLAIGNQATRFLNREWLHVVFGNRTDIIVQLLCLSLAINLT